MSAEEILTPDLAKNYPTGDEPSLGDILDKDTPLDAPVTRQNLGGSTIMKTSLKPLLGAEDARFFEIKNFRADPVVMFDYGYILANGGLYDKDDFPRWDKLVLAGLATEWDSNTFQTINVLGRYQKNSLSSTLLGNATAKNHGHILNENGQAQNLGFLGGYLPGTVNSNNDFIMSHSVLTANVSGGFVAKSGLFATEAMPVNKTGPVDAYFGFDFHDRLRNLQGVTDETPEVIYNNRDELGLGDQVNPLYYTTRPYVYFGQNMHNFATKPEAKQFAILKYDENGNFVPSSEIITLAASLGYNPDQMEAI